MNGDFDQAAEVPAVDFGEFSDGGESAVPTAPQGAHGTATGSNLDLLLDVGIEVTVEVGRTRMTLDEVLQLVPGSVVRLDKKAEEPVDLRVHGKLVARGEVVMVDDSYGLRITKIIDPRERLESLR